MLYTTDKSLKNSMFSTLYNKNTCKNEPFENLQMDFYAAQHHETKHSPLIATL